MLFSILSFTRDTPTASPAVGSRPSVVWTEPPPSASTRFTTPGANREGGLFPDGASGKDTCLVLLTEVHCHGYIGHSLNMRMCLLDSEVCGSVTHTGKLETAVGRLFIKVPNKDQGFMAPSLSLE